MLDNTLPIRITADSDTPINLSLVDTDNGRSVRRKVNSPGNFYELTIAKSETKENPGMVTERQLIRMDHVKPDATTGKPVRASAYIVLSTPRVGFTYADIKILMQALVLLIADPTGEHIQAAHLNNGPENDNTGMISMLNRLFDGEL